MKSSRQEPTVTTTPQVSALPPPLLLAAPCGSFCAAPGRLAIVTSWAKMGLASMRGRLCEGREARSEVAGHLLSKIAVLLVMCCTVVMFGARWRESVVLNMLMLSAYPIVGTKGLLSAACDRA